MDILNIGNDGPLIKSTNYWGSEQERAGKFLCSCNADRTGNQLFVPDIPLWSDNC